MKYQFTFTFILIQHLFLFAQGVWQQLVLQTEIWSDHHPVCLEWHEETEDRLNPEELYQRLQDASRNQPAKLPEKLCASAPRAKAALNAQDAHTKCWFN